ncbi:WD40-repeat-containing domain [Pseudocohnilembus persalinus]|uniref:WD40-repeat-containing domain n=1 Tax=Pseudocohnilembus persalinus TaxID=266149 RepID=A0A0V0QHQ9_PSEPJ|nr:WD40-repeat-containing domain [Pseudocohnilembus persalinus]|eukprot:KRX01656.1 WD40-repeat-containing domain [Pseudocohnilembus persalinus]
MANNNNNNNNQEHIYYGSLEEQERRRIEQEELESQSDTISVSTRATGISQTQSFLQPNQLNQAQFQNHQQQQQQQQRGIDLEQLLTSNNNQQQDLQQQQNMQNYEDLHTETIELSEEAKAARIRQQEALKTLQLQQALTRIQLPTKDLEVKLRLRELGHPIHYFAEEPATRRERLRKLIAQYMTEHDGEMPQFSENVEGGDVAEENEYFLYMGPEELKPARKNIVSYSLKAAALRIEKQKLRQAQLEPLEQEDEIIKENFEASKFQVVGSQYADTNTISKGAFSKDNQFYATAGGSGICKIWNIPNCDEKTSLNGHVSKVHDIQFHPESTIGLSESSYANLATCGQDQNIRLWTFKQEEQYQKSTVLRGHEDRVNKVNFHPNGKYLFSTSHDSTWRFWDIETQKTIVTQTGHSTGVYAMAMHPDGSILYTGDMGGQGALWDLRSGKNILMLNGHVKYILCADFHSNGYQLATGGDDNTLRFWDIRRKNCVKIVPGHVKLISDLKYQPQKSMFLSTVSYDNQVKIWNSQTFDLTQTLTSHDSKVTGVDISEDSMYMATTAFDRKFMLWKKSTD